MTKNINVLGAKITLSKKNEQDYISLTDIAKYKNSDKTGLVISHWLSTKYTIEFLGFWEKMHNNIFNVTEFSNIKNEAGSHGFILSSSKWIKETNAIGIISKTGRYGGTYAHKDIAFEFASWISPEFKLYIIKEFQRLKEDEYDKKHLGWEVKRELAKINYKIQTDSIKENLIPTLGEFKRKFVYSDEADLLNILVFGKTAKIWRDENIDKKGNIRDYANAVDLVILSNLENFNAEFIRQGLDKEARYGILLEIVINQRKSLSFEKNKKVQKENMNGKKLF